MRQVRIIMGTPITIEIVDREAAQKLFDEVFEYFTYVDEKFSTYKESSEITAINQRKVKNNAYSEDMKIVLELSEETKQLTGGYFDIVTPEGVYDPSGLVKGWAIFNAAKILKSRSVHNFYVEAGGDIQTSGLNSLGEAWIIGIQNPFSKKREVVKTVHLRDMGIATSGSYVRGKHIYNPVDKTREIRHVLSITVIGPNIYEADRFATAAYAMGSAGIDFIEQLEGFEGYSIDDKGIATMTTGFNNYLNKTYA